MGEEIDSALVETVAKSLAVEQLKDKLLVCFLRRLGGAAAIPSAEVDDASSRFGLSFRFDEAETFHFKLETKQ